MLTRYSLILCTFLVYSNPENRRLSHLTLRLTANIGKGEFENPFSIDTMY